MTTQHRHTLPHKHQLTLLLMLAVFVFSLCINLFSQTLATTLPTDDAPANIATLAMEVTNDADDPLDMLAIGCDLPSSKSHVANVKQQLLTAPYFAPITGASPRAPPTA
jgi:hypothetical protein